MKSRLIFILFFTWSNFIFCQHSSDTAFMGWPEKVHYITYRTSGIPDSLITYHLNGKVKSRHYYQKGKVEGNATSYYDSGNLKSKIFHQDGQAKGPARFYYQNGQMASEGDMKENNREGIWNYYDSTGVKKLQTTFARGKRDGEELSYYSNGNVSSKTYYEKGSRKDSICGYFPSGRIKFRGQFRKNKMYGERLYYNESGQLINGSYIYYHENGKKEREVTCRKGLPEGEMRLYDKKEKLIMKADFKNGEPDGMCYQYKNEKIISVDLYKKGKFIKTLEGSDIKELPGDD
ncbi:MAG: toxin-antitoxin system YwqK family antitoxin [Bacteroidia bacterium]